MSNSAQITSQVVDVRLQGLLKALRLPTIAQHYQSLARQALEQGQGYPEYLLRLLEQEYSQRDTNRRQRLLRQAKFPIMSGSGLRKPTARSRPPRRSSRRSRWPQWPTETALAPCCKAGS